MSESRYFLTVDWCGQGKRGIFCDSQGQAIAKEMPHDADDFWRILDAFGMVLAPQSQLLLEEEVEKHVMWTPLAEFNGVYGIAVREAVQREVGIE